MSHNIIYLSKNSFWDTDKNQLISSKKPVELKGRAPAVMEYLVRESGLSKAVCRYVDIVTNSWPEDHDIFDRDEANILDTLAHVVSEFNRTLGKVDPDLSDRKNYIIQGVKGQGYRLNLPPQEDNDGTVVGAYIKPGENLLYAAEQYRRWWAEVDLLFIKNRKARSIKKYFYSLRDQLPPEEDMDLSLAIAELMRDVVSYTEILLDFAPDEATQTEHRQEKGLILGSMLAKHGIDQFEFSSEKKVNISDLFHSNEIYDVRSVAAVGKIILEIDRLFIDNPEITPLRKYFYDKEKRRELPTDCEELELANSVCEFLKDQFLAGERLLKYIPGTHRDSFSRYKAFILQSELMNEYRCNRHFPWPWDE